MLQSETFMDSEAWRSSVAKLLMPETRSLEKNAHSHVKEHTLEKKLSAK